MYAGCARRLKPIRRIPYTSKRCGARGIYSRPVQRRFFWKLALSFLALLVSVLLAVDFLAEGALRDNYVADQFQQLKSLAREMRLQPIPLTSASPQTPDEIAALNTWVAANATSGARISVITADGRVLADSQSETST